MDDTCWHFKLLNIEKYRGYLVRYLILQQNGDLLIICLLVTATYCKAEKPKNLLNTKRSKYLGAY